MPLSRPYSVLLILALTLLNHCQSDELPSYLAKIYELRDTVNQRRPYLQKEQRNVAKQKRPKKYKCILIDDDEEQKEEDTTLTSRLDRLKAPSFMKELKIKASRKHNHDEENEEEVGSQFYTTTHQPNPPFYGLPAEDETNSFVHTPKPYEVEEPTEPPPATTPVNQRQISTSLSKPLRQVMLPRAHGIPLRRVMPASQPEAVQVQPQQQLDSQAAAPPPSPLQPEANVARDGSNRALVLAPENCKMIEHYAGLYGVKDVKSWVHHNCSFAKMYLPTASCAEIDILVGSCNIAGSAQT